MKNFILDLSEKIINEKHKISFEDALKLTEVNRDDLLFLIYCANLITKKFNKTDVELCSILNVKSGACSEDCKFCGQSIFYNTGVSVYEILDKEKIFESAKNAKKNKANRFCVVTSGNEIKDRDFEKICETLNFIKYNLDINLDASLGRLTRDKVILLKKTGLSRYNHNIETSESFFANICTTHTFKDRLHTILLCKQQGLDLCTGGIIGLGENYKHRIEFAFILKELDINYIPLNFLHPIAGTPLENIQPLKPLEILKIISIFRFILPDKNLRICGGREKNLRSLQPLIFFAGANGIIIGDYLTTHGQASELDLQMLDDLELKFY